MTTKKPNKPSAKKKVKPVAKKRPKAGSSKQSVKDRKTAFAYAYIANGKNGVHAAITEGYSKHGAGTTAFRLLKHEQVKQIMYDSTKKAAAIAGLSVERTLKEVARLAYADPRKLFDEAGQL